MKLRALARKMDAVWLSWFSQSWIFMKLYHGLPSFGGRRKILMCGGR